MMSVKTTQNSCFVNPSIQEQSGYPDHLIPDQSIDADDNTRQHEHGDTCIVHPE